MNIEFNLKTKTYIGQASLLKIEDFLKENKYHKVGLIIDNALKGNLFISELKEKLDSSNKISLTWYYDLPFEPDYVSLDEKKLLFKANNNSIVDVIIAIGGGSVIDFGKGIATLITNNEPALSYRGFPKGLNPSIPLIAVPTTAGTASEVTFNAVFTDTESGRKLGINTHNNFPVLAVLDSNMTLGCPFKVALSSGLDALVHTFESFACNNSNLYTRMFSREAFKVLYSNIEAALLEPDNAKAREQMLFGAYLAGIALFNSGSGPAGALSYPLGVVGKVPHGIAVGCVLPHLIQFNVSKGYNEYAELYDSVFHHDDSKVLHTDQEKSEKIVSLMFDLYNRLKVWDVVKQYNIDLNSKELNEYIDLLQGGFDQNPIKIHVSDGKEFINKIFNNDN